MLERIDVYPTHKIGGYDCRAGRPFPFGANRQDGGVNFSIYSAHATACTLVLYQLGDRQPLAVLPIPDAFRIGDVYCITVFGLDTENIEYGYRFDGPFDPQRGHRFDPHRTVLDPYAKLISGREEWGRPPDWDEPFPHRGRLLLDDFDWQGDRPLQRPIEDLVIYEMHVRGFTAHASSGVRHGGTFAAIRDQIPYLQRLGVNCVELMPIFEFDEWEHSRLGPDGYHLMNYWGYSSVGFFAPKAGYAASGANAMQADELKATIKALHEAGIEVILDVVFNHTAEGNELGPYLSFKGIDNRTYYMLTPSGHYQNFSGTGNTLNCNHHVVRTLVLDCLRYWAADYHIDGFRFDLASILGRAGCGTPLANPPLLESLAHDPVLSHCKLIAEAWDAGGLYQVGSFPNYGRWAEWNGKFRDAARKFLKGDGGTAGEMAARMLGSPDLYGDRGATCSINFITCHDGFTLADLVSYSDKHNAANGEDNRDGANDNYAWNCGVEGPTDDPAVRQLRLQQTKNAALLLLLSRGVPMLLMGDEVGRTQHGNNNTYCHDAPWNWLDWSLAERNEELLRFWRAAIAMRRRLRPLRRLSKRVDVTASDAYVQSWHGTRAWHADWGGGVRTLAFLIAPQDWAGGGEAIYAAMNMHWEDHRFELPAPPPGHKWRRVADTAAAPPDDICESAEGATLEDSTRYAVAARSIVVLVSSASAAADGLQA